MKQVSVNKISWWVLYNILRIKNILIGEFDIFSSDNMWLSILSATNEYSRRLK